MVGNPDARAEDQLGGPQIAAAREGNALKGLDCNLEQAGTDLSSKAYHELLEAALGRRRSQAGLDKTGLGAATIFYDM